MIRVDDLLRTVVKSTDLTFPLQEKCPKMAAPAKWGMLFMVVVICAAEASPQYKVRLISF